MPSQEEMQNEAPVLFGKLDILEEARKAVAERIAEQKWDTLISFLNKYAGRFPQVVLARDEGYQTLTLGRLFGEKVLTPVLPLHNLLIVPTPSGSVALIDCVIDEKHVYRYLQEINTKLFRDEISVAVRACINARLATTEEVPQVVIPEGFIAFRFDAMWAAGGYNDDHPTTLEAVIEANDISSGFDVFHERLGLGWWLDTKNFIGNFWIASHISNYPYCAKWHQLELVSENGKSNALGHYWGVELDWHQAKLAERPIVHLPGCVA